ncbi:MAG: hypothetical protein WCP11_00145 [Candidatus Saccharibacteria bacterium]
MIENENQPSSPEQAAPTLSSIESVFDQEITSASSAIEQGMRANPNLAAFGEDEVRKSVEAAKLDAAHKAALDMAMGLVRGLPDADNIARQISEKMVQEKYDRDSRAARLANGPSDNEALFK